VVDSAETSEITEVVNNEDEFELFLSSQSSISTVHSGDNDNAINIKILLNDFKNIKREPYISKVMNYWETEKLNKPELYKLACIVHAVPATQVRNVL